jgi:rhodanese-related sulfurtransferase
MRHNPSFVKLVEEVRNGVQECSVEEMKAQLAQPTPLILIDVREDHEVKNGVIPGAMHLGRGILERDIETKVPDKTMPLYLYCGGGYRSALAADSLQKMGYVNVWSVKGGIKAWTNAGFPLVTI